MDTATNFLQQAVCAGEEQALPYLATFEETVARVEKLSRNLVTADEQKILDLVHAVRTSNLRPINLSVAIAHGGVNQDHFPRLALASYGMSFTKTRVFTDISAEGSVSFYDNSYRGWRYDLPEGTFPRATGMFRSWTYPISASAPVPLVPPELRTKDSDHLVVLFEVTEWQREMPAAVDPYLLKVIAGDIAVVMGTWDITKLELSAFQAARDLRI